MPLVRQSSTGSGGREMARQGSVTSHGKGQSNYGAIPLERKNSVDSYKGVGTPPGSLNRRRPGSTDSPRESRNPLRKISNSSLTNCLSGDVTYSRVDSPELPAVHYMNINVQGNSLPRHEKNIQSAMFDSLKSTNVHEAPKSVSKPSPRSSGIPVANQIPPSGKVKKTLLNDPQPRSSSSVHSSPQTPIARPTPLVFAGVAPAMKSPTRPLFSYPRIQENSDPKLNNYTSNSVNKDIPCKEFVAMNNMLKELGQSLSPTSDPSRKPLLKSSAIPAPPRSKVKRPQDDLLVTGVYKEPIDKTVAGINNKKTGSVSKKPVNLIDFENSGRPPLLSNLPRSPSAGSRSSNSSRSTLTPTSALLASIDGKTMSILGPPSSDNDFRKPGCLQLTRNIPLSSEKSGQRNGSCSPPKKIPSKIPRAIASPDRKKFSFSGNRLPSPAKLSDDDVGSNSSYQTSDNSYALEPIPLKHAGYNRQLSCPDPPDSKRSSQREERLRRFGLHSKSSDTLSSSGRKSPATPRFPVPDDSDAFSDFFQELMAAASSPRSRQDASMSTKPPSSGVRKGTNSKNCNGARPKQTSFNQNGTSFQNSDVVKALVSPKDNRNVKKDVIKPKTSFAWQPKFGESNREKTPEAAPSPPGQRPNGVPNPYQVKRRQNFGLPPRHCRSLDYIPSDREDGASSAASSANVSPKLKHALLFPYAIGNSRKPMAMDSISVSSVASSSEMSRSDPAINFDSGSAAYESEYDNYRPGMASDEDYFLHDNISDVDLDLFDDINIDNVTVSDTYSLDMPLRKLHKKITDV